MRFVSRINKLFGWHPNLVTNESGVSITMKEQKEKIPKSEKILFLALITSVIYSLYLFCIEGDTYSAIFIGLWVPFIMGLINYIKFTKRYG